MDLAEIKPAITIDQHTNYNKFNISPEAVARIKSLNDVDFEKELQQFDTDTQMFLRIVRDRKC